MSILSIPFSTQQAESSGVKCPALNENMYIISMPKSELDKLENLTYTSSNLTEVFNEYVDYFGYKNSLMPNSKLNFGYTPSVYDAEHDGTALHSAYKFDSTMKNNILNTFFNVVTYNDFFSSWGPGGLYYWNPIKWNGKNYNNNNGVSLRLTGGTYPVDNGKFVGDINSTEYSTGIAFNRQLVFSVTINIGYPIKSYTIPLGGLLIKPYYSCPTFNVNVETLILPKSCFDENGKITTTKGAKLVMQSIGGSQIDNYYYGETYGGEPTCNYTLNIQIIDGIPDNLDDFLVDTTPKEIDTEPFADKGGESGTGGGKGDGDTKSDEHPVPSPPSVSISDTGYFTIYNPTQVQMKQLSAKLWSGDFDLTNIKSLMSSPIENILSLAYVPLPVSGATAVTAKIGGADMGVAVNKIDKHFFQLDLGTVAIKEFYGSYLDYYPHTVVYIFLPYIGIISLDTNEVMGKTLRLVYNYDVVTGSVIAYISTNGLNSKLYEYNGNCIYNLPVTGRDFSTIISGALGLASSAVGAVVTHGASIPFSVGTVGESLIDTQLPNYKHSGDVGGSPAIMDDRQPCVIIIRPRKINSKHQPKYTGYGSLITKKLSNVSGFTMVNDIRLNGISGATDIEIEEIRTMLKEGVVF